MYWTTLPAFSLNNNQTVGKKTTLQVFFVHFVRPVSPSSIYGSLLISLMLLTTTANKKQYSREFVYIRVYLRGTAGFTEQRTTYPRVPLMSVLLRSERSRGLAGMQRDKAPVEWPRSEGGDPTEGSMLGRLLWKPTPKRGPLHESH